MMNEGSRMGQVNQPVLPLTPAKARSVGPSAGLLEDADGGVVFVFGLATFGYASTDQAGRRLAAVQLVTTRIAAEAEVSTATVRVALGRVRAGKQQPAQEPAVDHDQHLDQDADSGDENAVADLVVLAPPVPRAAERVAARFGDLVEAPVLITQGAQLPLAGLLLALPALEMTGLLEVAQDTFGRMRKGFYGLRVILLMGVFMALLREPRAGHR